MVAFLVIGTSSLRALAEPSSADDLFHEGRALMQDGHVPEACEKFAESVALLRRGGALLNLAVCRVMEGRNATALPLLEEAREFALKDERADRVALAEARIQEVRSRLSWLTVLPPPGAAPPDLTIQCDGEDMVGMTWGTPGAVDPGPHTVVAAALGRVPFRATVVIGSAGDRQTVQVPALAEVPPLASDSSAESPKRALPSDLPPLSPAMAHAWRKPLAWAAMGIGVATATVGGAFGVESLMDNNASKPQCLGNGICSATGYERNQAARTAADVADLTIPAGLVAAGAGLYLLLASRSVAAPQPTVAGFANPSEPRAHRLLTGFVPWVARGTATISFQSTW
jgi:hypothetical protein